MADERMRSQVRREKEKYEKDNEQKLEQTKETLKKECELVPVGDTGHQNVNKLMREYYDEETLAHMQLSKDKVKALSNALRTLSKNVIKASVAPIGHSCPIELMLIDQWEKEYVDDLGVDIQSKIEVDLIRDMIEADIIDWRTSHELAKGGLFDWNTVGVSEKGEPIIRKEENAAISIKLKFKARKDRLREDLMATRKIKAKFGLNKTVDPSKFASNLNERFKEIKSTQFEEMDDDLEIKVEKEEE